MARKDVIKAEIQRNAAMIALGDIAAAMGRKRE